MNRESAPDMNKTTKPLILLAGLILSGLCACEGSAATDMAGPESGYVTGKVVDTRGEPIAGADILLDSTVFHSSYIRGSTGKDGTYRLKAQPGAWMAYAHFKKTYNGRTYTLELHPESSDSFDDEGSVRNFTWKLEGRSPLNEYRYYGGFILVHTANDFYEDQEKIELTLTPIGPLIDGSEGKPLRLRMGDRYWVQLGHLEDIPIGRYMVTAILESDEGSRQLRIQDRHTSGDFEQEFQLDFLPVSSATPGANSAAIVLGY
jgi:hypothetical protein